MIKKISTISLLSFLFVSFFSLPIYSELSCNLCDGRAWVSAEYLIWKIRDSPEPTPLVREFPATGGSKTVLGRQYIDSNWHSGGRFGLGYWFDCLGFEANYFFLAKRSKDFSVASNADGSPSLRVPYFNVTTGLEDSSPIAKPGVFRGKGVLKLDNRMQGAELNVLKTLPSCNNSINISLLAGFRYLNFDENLKFFVNSPTITPSIYNYTDKFNVQNNFYGSQIGASIDCKYCAFALNIKGKVALGSLSQRVTIKGKFHTNEFTGSVETFKGGFFALPTNIGHHTRTCFSVLPQGEINFGYQIMRNVELRVGYSVLYVSNVLYAGKQINRNINPTQSANIEFTPTPELVGEASPKAKLRSTGLWVQGFNVGLVCQF